MLREVLPSPDLRNWVDRFWIRADAILDEPVAILPDGSADIVFDLGGNPGPLSEAFVVGAMTRPLVISGRSPKMLGIRFRPGRAGAFLRCRLGELTDDRVPLGAVVDSWRAMAEDAAGRGRLPIDHLEDAMRQRLGQMESDPRIDAAVALIRGSAGTMPVETVAERVAMTRQHLARLFDVHVGMRPKTFARVMRFRRAARLGRRMPWPDVAAALGYADQSHLIADFRQFGGTSPVPFLLSRASGQS